MINYTNLARAHGPILHTTVGIGYEGPWRQVEAMLLITADQTPGILKQPLPFVQHTALADFDVNYERNACCDDEKQAQDFTVRCIAISRTSSTSTASKS